MLVRIYYNAVFGGLGGLIGWMLFGIFGDRNPTDEITFLLYIIPMSELVKQALLGGALIGGMIGFLIVSVEAIRDLALVKFARLSTYGVLIGGAGGAIGNVLGDYVNYWLVHLAGEPSILIGTIARALGWMLLGVAIGVSEGVAARSLGKFSYSSLGGAIGGLVGGGLFGLFYNLAIRSDAGTTVFWGGFGLVILGACIGSLSALVQSVFQPASVKVLRGWQEGREYPLEKQMTLSGRDEHVDIPLFRDMKVEKEHVYFKRVENRFLLVNNDAPPENTLVNEQPIADSIELHDGDRIQLGNVILRFQMREAVVRERKARMQAEGRSTASGSAVASILGDKS